MPNVSWKHHRAMRLKFGRMKVPHPASLSTLILEAFLENGGLLPAREYYGSEHEVKGKKYHQWVDDLRSLGIIEPYKSDDLERKGDDWIRFKPGKIVRDYINKEKAHQEEMASMRDLHEAEDRISKKVDRVADDVQDLKAQIHRINMLMAELKRLQAPPPNAAAQLRSDEIVDEINGLMAKAGLKSN
jgi:outer membrane murein-binding lipoprotein Lpp